MGQGLGIFGGILGFALGGPVGALIGAALGASIDEDGAQRNNNYNGAGSLNGGSSGQRQINVDCPYCGADIIISFAGLWKCPSCRNDFIYDGENAIKKESYEGAADKLDGSRQQIWLGVFFGLLGKMAKADGHISKEEISFVSGIIDNDFKLNSEDRKFAQRAFMEAKNANYSFEDIARQYHEMFKQDTRLITSMFGLLAQTAFSDGVFAPEEEALMKKAQSIFGISDYDYEDMKAFYSKQKGVIPDNDIKKSYEMLGCSESDTVEKIRESYKKMARDYHPDMIISKNLPDDFVKYATKRFQQIQDAYEKIKKHRGF